MGWLAFRRAGMHQPGARGVRLLLCRVNLAMANHGVEKNTTEQAAARCNEFELVKCSCCLAHIACRTAAETLQDHARVQSP